MNVLQSSDFISTQFSGTMFFGVVGGKRGGRLGYGCGGNDGGGKGGGGNGGGGGDVGDVGGGGGGGVW